MASPEEPPFFNTSPSELTKSASDLIDRINIATNDLVRSVSPELASFDNTIIPFANIENEIKGKVQYMALFQAVSPNPEMRKASSTAVSMVDKAYLGLFRDESLFALVDAVQNTCPQHSINAEDRKYLKKLHSLFWDNGIGLEGSSKKRFNEISNRLVELQVAFMENLGSDPGYTSKTKDELVGLAGKELDNLSDGIPLKKSQINMVLSRCQNSDTRKEIFLRGQNIFPDNVDLLKETVILRDEAARLLGFSSFLAQKGSDKMLSSPESIYRILDELADHLRPIAHRELERMRHLREGSDDSFYLWDFDYYHDLLLREQYNIDHELISEYFPASFTVGKMLTVFEGIFGLLIKEIKDIPQKRVWHPEVQVFRVQCIETSRLLGFLYVDIFPRAGKFSHAANFNIYPSYKPTQGEKPPVVCTALVCNLSQPSPGKPVLLKHREVVTLFHELGHGIHDLLGRSKYATFHGHRTVSDFRESPSQLLEYWCWVPECLQMLSCHYSGLSLNGNEFTSPNEVFPLPVHLVRSLSAAKEVNQAISTLRQIAFSKFDMKIHHPESHEEILSMKLDETFNSLLEKETLLSGPEDNLKWGNGFATIPHFMWGQEANYYSYVYTRLLAADIWHSVFARNPMSRETGLKYRKLILEPGGTGNELDAVKEFLRKEPTAEAYLRDLTPST
ncbi:hypothetical protein N7488_000297 [Penicillium malachiteum]|nr:hypothetical protein N7488_000297 [Penicillium malachiteum]